MTAKATHSTRIGKLEIMETETDAAKAVASAAGGEGDATDTIPAGPEAADPRKDSFGEIVVLWERPVEERDQDGPAKIDDPAKRASSPRRDGEEAGSVSSDEAAPAPAPLQSPRSPRGLFDLLRPFGSPGSSGEAAASPGPSSRPGSPPHHQSRGLLGHLFVPRSPGSPASSTTVSETDLLLREIDERDARIRRLEATVASDAEALRKTKDIVGRLSVELLAARRAEEALRELGPRSSLLEDAVEVLRVENTKLRIRAREVEEERRRVEGQMRTELELLRLEREATGYLFER